jgi:hypothetical protein
VIFIVLYPLEAKHKKLKISFLSKKYGFLSKKPSGDNPIQTVLAQPQISPHLCIIKKTTQQTKENTPIRSRIHEIKCA